MPDAASSAPARPDSALFTRGLTKRFGEKVAVDRLDLEVPRGCFFGLVGPNGAGKTTTLRMVTGLLRPDEGFASIDGVDVWRDPVRAKTAIGVVPDELRLFERLTGRELLTYNGLLRGFERAVVTRRADALLAVLGLTEAADTLVVDYSHGMKKKVALAAALLHGPRVLFLDEPFEGIDPISARVMRDVLERDVKGGATVILSSHVMELVEKICDRVGIIHQGRLIVSGTLDEVRAGRSLEEKFLDAVGAGHVGKENLEWLGSSSD
jgi:ABC-2 type transport system ATP-binding protein